MISKQEVSRMRNEMSRRVGKMVLFGCVLSVCLAIPAGAVELGEKIGPLELTTLDGPSFVMDNYDVDGRIGTVIAFLSARCPVTDQMAERINYVQEEYRHDDILWVGIGANPAESGEELREFCQRRGMIFPVYLDPQQKIRKRFGPKVTPEVFLLDSESVVVYHGAIGKTEDSALEAAIKALQDEKEIKVKHIPAKGTPINKPGPKREIDDPYGSIAFSSELLFEKIEEASAHHCSTLTEAPNGDLLCLWYGGSYEASDDQKLFMARRKKGHRTWEKPEAIAGNSIKPAGNAIIFTDGSVHIRVLWGRKEGDRPRRRGSGGTGRLLYRISADNGKTWQTSAPYRGGSQPTVIERDDSSLFIMMRCKPIIKQTISENGGKSWSEAGLSVLPNPNAGIAMTKLKNGHVVLVFNNTNEGRSPLNIARSLDGGRTWEEPLVLESNQGEYSYLCVIQTLDDRIHISYTFRRYTIKHVEMNENWLVRLKRPN